MPSGSARLANAMALLQGSKGFKNFRQCTERREIALIEGPSCDDVDLTDFDWINSLQGRCQYPSKHIDECASLCPIRSGCNWNAKVCLHSRGITVTLQVT